MATLPAASHASALLPVPCVVRAVTRETEDCWTLSLDPPPGPGPRPGQFNMLYAFGVGEAPISVSGACAPGPGGGGPERLVHTIRAVGPVSRALCAVRPGDTIGVRGPFGTAWPWESARGRDLLVVVGGLGLAPLRPALLAALAERAAFRRVILLVGSREPSGLLFREELRAWDAGRELEVLVTVDAAGGDWTGHVGVVTTLIPRARLSPRDTVALVCGPEVMMRFVAADLIAAGVPPADVHVSLERNMKCAVAQCGHCQLAGSFVCKDGPVFPYPRVAELMLVREL
ncbi:MAG: FAD/NAD(P)-binding protein [Planctomycetota bacterium]